MINIRRNDKCFCKSGKKYKLCCINKTFDKNTLLYIGNGFTLNFIKNFKIELDSSKPLSNFDSNNINYDDIFIRCKKIEALLKKNLININSSEFEVIDATINNFKQDKSLICNFNRFLTLIFSKFQLELNKSSSSIKQWNFYTWLSSNQYNISHIISLNYDLHLENTLTQAQINYGRMFTSEINNYNLNAIRIYKPHGSIDFDISNNFIKCPDEMRWYINMNNNTTKLKDLIYQEIVKKDRWLIPRLQSDIIPPSQKNNLLDLPWVKETYFSLNNSMKHINYIINIGFSYSEPDRMEYNSLIDNWNNTEFRKVIDFNTNENLTLKNHLKTKNIEYEFIGLDLSCINLKSHM